MDLEQTLALAGIAAVLIGTASTLYGVFAAPSLLTYAQFEAGHRDAPMRAAISQKYSRPVPPYTAEDVRIAQKEVDLQLADRFMEVAKMVDAARDHDARKTQQWATPGILLITSGSVAQGVAILVGS
jgi:hypothetical protein